VSESVTFDGELTVLRMERRLPHPPAKVWRAVTEPAHLAGWFPARVEIDLTVGGKVRFVFAGDQASPGDGVVTDLDPPRLLAYSWGDDHLRWELTADGPGTVLLLTHTFADRAGAAGFAAGWDVCFDALQRVAGADRVDPAWADGPGEPPADLDARHEDHVRRLALDVSSVQDTPDGPRLRIERQLVRPAAVVWPLLRARAGDAAILTEQPPVVLEYELPGGGRAR
jgi:uncharacterized protein YndB with AHSA1/START domain